MGLLSYFIYNLFISFHINFVTIKYNQIFSVVRLFPIPFYLLKIYFDIFCMLHLSLVQKVCPGLLCKVFQYVDESIIPMVAHGY